MMVNRKLITEHRKRELSNMERKVITFLDKSKERDRTKSHDAYIKWWNDIPLIHLVIEDTILIVEPMILVSLVGKHLIKITFGRVKLDTTVYYRRSHSILWKAGYFNDAEL